MSNFRRRLMMHIHKNSIDTVTEDGVPIPKGFIYLTGTKETGTVIKDDIGNEFVWIPATVDTYVKDFSFPNSYGSTANNTKDNTLPNGIIDETTDIKKYGGFYIGRYEAGIPENQTTIDGINKETSNVVAIPVSKKKTTIWTNIDYINAKASAEIMINTDYVQSGLITGRAWDRTCHFIEDAVPSLTDSTSYGNYPNSTSPADVNGYGKKHKTGFSEYWKVKNIYDLAGSVLEWTNEFSGNYGVVRGGWYGEDKPVCNRARSNMTNKFGSISFRVRLYIK